MEYITRLIDSLDIILTSRYYLIITLIIWLISLINPIISNRTNSSPITSRLIIIIISSLASITSTSLVTTIPTSTLITDCSIFYPANFCNSNKLWQGLIDSTSTSCCLIITVIIICSSVAITCNSISTLSDLAHSEESECRVCTSASISRTTTYSEFWVIASDKLWLIVSNTTSRE